MFFEPGKDSDINEKTTRVDQVTQIVVDERLKSLNVEVYLDEELKVWKDRLVGTL